MDQFQLFVIIDQSSAWTSDKNQAIYYMAQLLWFCFMVAFPTRLIGLWVSFSKELKIFVERAEEATNSAQSQTSTTGKMVVAGCASCSSSNT